MRKLLKVILAAVLAGAMLFALCMPGHAIMASECGTFVTKNPSYNKDGQYYMSFTIQAGQPPNTSGYTTLASARLINSAGQTVATWPQREISSGTTQTREYYTSYSNRPHGTYTFALDITSRGREYGTGKTISYSFTWKYTVNHTGGSSSNSNSNNSTAVTPKFTYYSKELVHSNGNYVNKFVFNHSNAKGIYANLEIFDPSGYKVFSRRGDNPISSNSGTYWFTWNGYSSNGGWKCQSGNYTLKYWLSGQSAKQVQLYLQISGEG